MAVTTTKEDYARLTSDFQSAAFNRQLSIGSFQSAADIATV
jgi:hypothetical protein